MLYLKLNWFEPTWRKEVLDATNARGVDFTQITLVAHLPPLPVAVLGSRITSVQWAPDSRSERAKRTATLGLSVPSIVMTTSEVVEAGCSGG